jgi:hypothetical protein
MTNLSAAQKRKKRRKEKLLEAEQRGLETEHVPVSDPTPLPLSAETLIPDDGTHTYQ